MYPLFIYFVNDVITLRLILDVLPDLLNILIEQS